MCICTARTALSLTMKRGKDIGKVEVGVANKVVGGYTTHTIGFWTPAPVYNGFLLIVNIPEQC